MSADSSAGKTAYDGNEAAVGAPEFPKGDNNPALLTGDTIRKV